jgi:putative membrane protein
MVIENRPTIRSISVEYPRWLIAVVAALHLVFLAFEMFFWTRFFAALTLKMSPEQARASWPVAANQGLSNGFLAFGLAWTLWGPLPPDAVAPVQRLFLAFMVVAGLFGALTVNPPPRDRPKFNYTFLAQILPALAALWGVWDR